MILPARNRSRFPDSIPIPLLLPIPPPRRNFPLFAMAHPFRLNRVLFPVLSPVLLALLFLLAFPVLFPVLFPLLFRFPLQAPLPRRNLVHATRRPVRHQLHASALPFRNWFLYLIPLPVTRLPLPADPTISRSGWTTVAAIVGACAPV